MRGEIDQVNVAPTALSNETSYRINQQLKLRHKKENECIYELQLSKLRYELDKHQFEITQTVRGPNLALVVNIKNEIIAYIEKEMDQLELKILEENEERNDRYLLNRVVPPNSIMEIGLDFYTFFITYVSLFYFSFFIDRYSNIKINSNRT